MQDSKTTPSPRLWAVPSQALLPLGGLIVVAMYVLSAL